MLEETKERGREPINEIKVGNVVLLVYEKHNPKTGNVYLDYKNGREFYTGDDQVATGIYLQQRDARDHVIALMHFMKFASDFHRERKRREDN